MRISCCTCQPVDRAAIPVLICPHCRPQQDPAIARPLCFAPTGGPFTLVKPARACRRFSVSDNVRSVDLDQHRIGRAALEPWPDVRVVTKQIVASPVENLSPNDRQQLPAVPSSSTMPSFDKMIDSPHKARQDNPHSRAGQSFPSPERT